MKRSAMIIKISNLLLQIAPESYEFQSSYGRQIDADYILSELEAAGMSPPYNLREIEDGYKVAFLEWEPE